MSVPDLSRQLGRYKLVRLLGEGNMGKVFRAVDTRLEREVALKVPTFSPNDDAAIKRFHREAHSAAVVNHPNICPVYDVEEISGVHFLTMPLLEGELLSNLVGPGKLWDMRKAAELIRTLALAMDEMHKKGLMHRDLKPANIMIRTRDKVPIIMDMGLARSYLSDLEMITVQGQKVGTPAYMSPEQVRGDVHMTHSCDIYSLGIILYQLLTGKVPFVGKPGHIYTHILNTPADPPSVLRPEIPKALDNISLRTLQKKPEDRFGTMSEFAQYLEQFLQAGEPRGAGGRGGPDDEKMRQLLEMLQDREKKLAVLTQAATEERKRRLELEQGYRALEHQVQSANGEVDMTKKMWASSERKYQEQVNGLNKRIEEMGRGAGPSEEQRRQVEKVQEQLRTKDSEIEMLKNFWQATERQYQYKMEDLDRQRRMVQDELAMVRGNKDRDGAWKQKHDNLERELLSLKTQHQGQVEQLTLAAEQARAAVDLERQAKISFEERLGALQSESSMVKRLWEHREQQLNEDLKRAQEDVRRLHEQLNQQKGIPPEKLVEAERQVRELQGQCEQEKRQREAADARFQEMEERLQQTAGKLQSAGSETDMIKRMWAATEKNYQEQIGRLQDDLARAQKAPEADKIRFERLTQQLLETQAQLAHNEETLHLLQEEQSSALEKLEHKTKEWQGAKEAILAEQQRRERLEKQLAERDAELRTAAQQAEADAQARQEEVQERGRAEERVKELEGQLAQTRADHQAWQERLEAARAREDELRQKLQASTEAAGQVAALQQRLRTLQDELAQEQEFRRQAEEEIVRIASASHAESDAKEKTADLEEQLAQEGRQRAEMQEQLDKLRQDVATYQSAAAQEKRQLAELEAKLTQEKQQRDEFEAQAEQLRNDLRSEQESVDGVIQLERKRNRELEDEFAATRARLEQELEQAKQSKLEIEQAPPAVVAAALEEKEEQIRALQEQVRTLESRPDRTQELETQLHALGEELARQQAQQTTAERLAKESQARAEELQQRLDAAASAAGDGQGEDRVRQVQHLWEQEKELRQEADDRAREAIDVAADLRRRLAHAEAELERERQAENVPHQRIEELDRQLMQVREKLMAAEYGQKDAEMKLGFLQKRMDAVDEGAAEDTRRRVAAERRQREAEAALEEERRLRQNADRYLRDLNDKIQQANVQLDEASRYATQEKHSRLLVEQEVLKLRALLDASPSADLDVPAVEERQPRSGARKRPSGDQIKPLRRTGAPPPLPPEMTDGATEELPAAPLPNRPTPRSGVRDVPARATPESTPVSRVQVELRGSWYCRPMEDSTAKWSKVAETPAQVQIKPGEIYFLKIANVVTDAELVQLGALRQVPSLHTLSLSGCPEVSDHALIHLRTLNQLQALNVASTPGITDAGLAHLRGLSRLTILSLASCAGITDAGLVHVGQLSNLQTLYLTNCTQLTDQAIAPLRRLTNLQTLFLDGCALITDAALEVAGALPQLQTLNLDRCTRLTDRGLGYLRNLSQLSTLSLDRCEQITDAGLLHLRELTNLQSLSVTYCPRITQAGLNHLQHLPKLQTVSSVAGPGQRAARTS